MPASMKNIAAASNPRTRQPPKPRKEPRAPLTAEEKKEKRDETAKNQAEIDDALGKFTEWMDDTLAKADALATKFGKKTRYFLNAFFQSGAHMVNRQEVVNPYNAFKAQKAAEHRENGEAMTVPELHREHIDEYRLLSDADKAELVEWYTEERSRKKIRRATPRARVQDVSNTVRNMQMLLQALAYRVGVEGFFVVVRNSADFHMAPYWYFTLPELERYMPLAVRKRWDTGEVGAKIEVFAVAGCDPMNLLRTVPQKVAYVKTEIRDLISQKLITITNDSNAEMQYVNYKEDIEHRYGVELVGWTPDKWCNPSKLTSSLPVLRTLLNALKSDECKFVVIPDTVLKACKAACEADIATGRIEGKHRNPRSDIGKKRKRAGSDGADNDVGNDDDMEDMEDTNTPQYSVEEPTNATRPAKRRKAANQTPSKKNKVNRRDDVVTQKAVAAMQARSVALQRLKAGNGPGSAVGRAYKSRAIISDDEDGEEALTGASAHAGLSAEELAEMERDPDADDNGPSGTTDPTFSSLTPAAAT
ncbi:hypothetical protein K438DRAFT_2011299 [Mycena galopus ATCC 62051]|nr:hypothetical protein K438DRAFT_2011297 [Mycena galopus ATCC 62051]KAF8210739.1 hypothetical protein K438DRAFT_2011299 [Mycena galopus ATCC 62051]